MQPQKDEGWEAPTPTAHLPLKRLKQRGVCPQDCLGGEGTGVGHFQGQVLHLRCASALAPSRGPRGQKNRKTPGGSCGEAP